MNKTTLLSCDQLLSIFSSSHIATAIYTTDNLIIEAATDAMINFWGKDRSIIGLPLLEAVPELAGQPFGELLRTVLRTGITNEGKGVPAVLESDGVLRTSYYDYEYKAIKNEQGECYCILHHATEVTERVLGLKAIENEKQLLVNLENEQALNEELTAANEKVSAAYEELYTINEELNNSQQSLYKLNKELEERVFERTKSLAASENNLRYLINDAPVAIGVLNGTDLIIEFANEYLLNIFGKSSEIIGKTLYETVYELYGGSFFASLTEILEKGNSYVGDEVKGVITYAGQKEEIYTNFNCKPLIDISGQTEKVIIIAKDVTEKVKSRIAIEESKHRLNEMIMTTPVAMALFNGKDLIIEQANHAMLNDTWHREKEEVLGKKLIEAFPELEGQQFPQLLMDVFDSGNRVAMPEVPVKIVLSDGSVKEIYVNFSYDPLKNKAGKVESILATVIDITAVVTARQLLERSEVKLQASLEETAATNEELQASSEELAATIEELQASSEEIAATNEELQASMEELAATNEEIAASHEEVLSTNEELLATQDQLEQVVLQIRESENRFKFLLNAIPQQVWTATHDGALNYLNERVCTDFGYENEEIIGYGWQKFIHADDLPMALVNWSEALKTGKEYLVEFRLLFSDGTYRWHLARALPLIENGRVTLWIGTNTDIHLQKNNEQLKDEFISIASHELKTPLTSIKAFNQLMIKTKDQDRLNGFVIKCSDNITRLEKLIADLLDVTKLNAGKIEYNMAPFSFKKLLMDTVESAQHIFPSHQIILETCCDIEFTGDQFRLEQVINNFLTNAVKYSPQGKFVLVNTHLDYEHIIVSIKDFGIGIAPSNINKLFDRYFRVDSTAMRFEGLGLGLFITSEILKRHSGEVWIESEVGKGSTFHFKLPVNPIKAEFENRISMSEN
ncbi:two-component system CheB/CheR fusion protein [Pedobacter cryoconitis]|uniref:PAS domain S-box protein n=1 Tax=Pedobacter cryoconitis TaxID=188932 RepID=UPI00161C35C5|nr:PAS domain S-box protein [Pedobacter cryoconitis]MBB6271258.1 two-component system CheB/CheR fusion protein [Pedobacter cryoconitis]